jgi:16S rRNA (cytidine1402-2'-O)-methyltransferase
MGKLYLVATPIGNLEDFTFRAVRILQEVSLIAAEDTRTTRTLLDYYQIQTRLTPYHDHNKQKVSQLLIDHLQSADLALVSDAGTPGINDPGYILVQAALEAGHQVVPIPGPSAPITALSASGLPTDSFLYLGYLPRKAGARQTMLQEVSDLPWTLIFLETPHRLIRSLEDCREVLGDRSVTVARELTKLHEELFRGTIDAARDHFSQGAVRGEITLVIAGKDPDEIWSEEKLIQEIQQRLQSEKNSPSQLAKQLARIAGWPRSQIYDLIQSLEP